MPRSPIVLALLMCVAFPASVPAQGLYEPFPEPAPSRQSQGYLDRLGVEVGAAGLAGGRFVATRGRKGIAPVATAAPARAASTRSGTGTSEGIALVGVMCAVLLGGGLLILRAHR